MSDKYELKPGEHTHERGTPPTPPKWGEDAREDAITVLRELLSEKIGAPGLLYYYHVAETCEAGPGLCYHCTLRAEGLDALARLDRTQ